MTFEEIKQYQDNTYVSLFGYTSCSLSKETALKFAWENSNSGHHKVLFHIVWKGLYNMYYLNAGAFDHEEEILLADGVKINVISVDEVKDA